ncbi:MAG TPA: PQQ-dependent sugar dehydrogenase, partial [Trueperaceae bacterium]|nr:PQQ-dependent sugar dehydrogenase [Trueperaceae bacterium]
MTAVALLPTAAAQGMVLPEGFVAESVVGGLSAPVDLAFAPDGRVFVAEKGGIVKIIDDGAVNTAPFLDISAEVNNVGDRGLVGIAVHPRFPELPYVYLSYVYDPPEVQALSGDSGPDGQGARVSRLVRVEADPATGFSTALAGTTVVLLGTNSTFENIGDVQERNTAVPSCGQGGTYVTDCLAADEHSHTIGRVRFGPDGALYVGSGDGADFNRVQPYHLRVQDLDSLAGKLLRLDPLTGEGLADNPFYDGNPSSNRSKVLSYGLRNPYSYTFHPHTWEPVIGDVGWATWEMVKVGAGLNFGWPCYEGGNGVLLQQTSFSELAGCQSIYAGSNGPIAAPLYAYNREGTGGAIMAGDIYTGALLPEELRGKLFIADYYAGWIRTVSLDDGDGRSRVEDFATVYYPVQALFGPDGQFYYLNVWGGELVRLRYTLAEPAQEGPTVVASVGPLAGRAPLFVKYDATGSHDPQGGAVTYLWTFAPGN